MAKFKAGLFLTKEKGFFGQMADSWREGWHRAEERERKNALIPNITIGRHTRQKEQRETEAYYNDVKRLYDASIFSKDVPVDDIVTHCVAQVFQHLERIPKSDPVIEAMQQGTAALLDDELFFGFPEIDWTQRQSMETLFELRRYLAAKEHVVTHDDLLEQWGDAVIGIWLGLLQYLPDSLFMPIDDDDEETTRSGSLTLPASLPDLMHAPDEAIEGLLAKVGQLDGIPLLQSTASRLHANLLTASGIHLEDAATSRRSLVAPSDAKENTPANLAQTYLQGTAFADFFSVEMPLVVPDEVRFEHCHIIGGTGHGKTQLLQYLIAHDLLRALEEQRSVIIIDSQGDLIRNISHLGLFSPSEADGLADRLVMISPNDIEHPVALNMFDVNTERAKGYGALEREKLLNGTIELYEYIFGALLGAELTQKQGVIFRYLARLMMVIPGATLHTLRELMENGRKFEQYIAQLDGSARHFFESQFFDASFAATKKQILRRLWGVVANPAFERMFSNAENKIDLFAEMNAGKIILIDTAKDLLKQEGCEIFGRFFVAKILQAAMERAVIPEQERCPTFVYVDEAHDYFDGNIEQLINQARKRKVALTLAHQNLDQLSAPLHSSIMASTSIKMAGGVSVKDAKTIAPDMHSDVDFLQSMRKRTDHTEFACWIKNTTENSIRVNIPLGFLEAAPRLSEHEYDALVAANRERYCADAAICQPEDDLDIEDNVVPLRQPQSPTAHRGLQQQIKEAAHGQGLSATIEQKVLDGAGSVDVALEAGDRSIACEISVTTSVEHELHNVEKCLAAGFDEVWLIAPDTEHLAKLQETIPPLIAEDQRSRIAFYALDEALMDIKNLTARCTTVRQQVLGYDVSIESRELAPAEQQARHEALRRLFPQQHGVRATVRQNESESDS